MFLWSLRVRAKKGKATRIESVMGSGRGRGVNFPHVLLQSRKIDCGYGSMETTANTLEPKRVLKHHSRL